MKPAVEKAIKEIAKEVFDEMTDSIANKMSLYPNFLSSLKGDEDVEAYEKILKEIMKLTKVS